MTDRSRTNADAPPRPKSVLFCPACGHESPTSGDWVVHRRPDRDALACPECRETVTTVGRVAQPVS